jgi:predicted nuclease of predicted toxin-antitoxin system
MTTPNWNPTISVRYTNLPPAWADAWLCEAAAGRESLAQTRHRLAELYPGSAHVSQFGLLASADREVWEFAKANDFVIVSTDSDFYELATTIGPPPRVVWLRRWTHPTRDAERVLRREAIRITEFAADPELGVLMLDRD